MSRLNWRLIRSGPLTGARNMALDEALLESVAAGRSGPVLRLYGWSPPTVTLGYFQRAASSVNLEACRDYGFDVVRRITGGRAVLHHWEVTYAVISPEKSPLFPGGIQENYRVIAQVLQQTLDSFGLATRLAAGRNRGTGGSGAQQSACFTAPAIHELVHAGCKVTGGAQKRHGSAFLQHGSIPLDLDPECLFRVLDTEGRIPVAEGGRLLARSVGWLNRWTASPVSVTTVEDRLLSCLAGSWDIALIEDSPTAAEEERAAQLEETRYGNPDWTFNGKVG